MHLRELGAKLTLSFLLANKTPHYYIYYAQKSISKNKYAVKRTKVAAKRRQEQTQTLHVMIADDTRYDCLHYTLCFPSKLRSF